MAIMLIASVGYLYWSVSRVDFFAFLVDRKVSLFGCRNEVYFARYALLLFSVLAMLGSVSLYQYLGFSREVSFQQSIQDHTMTQEKMSAFLQYRSRRYDQAKDWFYEARDWMSQKKYQEAVESYEKSLARLGEDSADEIPVLVEYAQAIFYANKNLSSQKMESVVDRILTKSPNQPSALGLKGIAEFDHQNYFQAIQTWQSALVYAEPKERPALWSGILKARQLGHIDEHQIPSVLTHRLKLQIDQTDKSKHWKPNAILLVYAVKPGSTMPIVIQKVFPDESGNYVMLTNLDNLMPGSVLGDTDRVNVFVKLTSTNERDLTKGRVIGERKDLPLNSREIFSVKVVL